jgi:hypothetical protein
VQRTFFLWHGGSAAHIPTERAAGHAGLRGQRTAERGELDLVIHEALRLPRQSAARSSNKRFTSRCGSTSISTGTGTGKRNTRIPGRRNHFTMQSFPWQLQNTYSFFAGVPIFGRDAGFYFLRS